jgi:hypothetical protein
MYFINKKKEVKIHDPTTDSPKDLTGNSTSKTPNNPVTHLNNSKGGSKTQTEDNPTFSDPIVSK